MPKESIIDPKEAVKLFSGWKEDMQLVLAEKKRQKDDLDHQITLKTLELSTLNTSIARERSEFDQWKREQTQEFQNEKDLKLNEMIKKEHQVDFGLTEVNKRLEEVENREKDIKDLENIKDKLLEERRAVQKLIAEYEALSKEAQLNNEKGEEKLSNAVQKEEFAKAEASRVKSSLEALNTETEAIEATRTATKKEIKNLENLRKEITPKLAQLEKVEKTNSAKLEKIEKEQGILDDKIAEEKIRFEEIKAESKRLDDFKRKLDQRSEELKREELLRK